MLKFAIFASGTLGLLYFAGVTPAGLEHAIERARQDYATVEPLEDGPGDWG